MVAESARMSPQRIQRKRTKGWTMPEAAVYVGRPTKWGNPFRVVLQDGQWLVLDDNQVDYEPWANTRTSAIEKAVELFYNDGFYWFGGRFEMAEIDVTELRGKHLACWCPLESPCHADVLLELANAPVPVEGLTL